MANNVSDKNSRKETEKALQTMKAQIEQLSTKNSDITAALQEKAKSDETGSGLMTLLKYMMNENKNTTMMLKSIYDRLERIDSDFNAGNYEQEDQDQPLMNENRLAKVQPISGLDAQIMQIIQIRGMACADDIKKQMNYRGRNAASSRLNKLYKQGLLERYQLGHKVYYKYDAGKTTNTLIVSPPQ
ncbi:MAG: winged helix-turn-helix domain-containing protein [Candidatus Micrarchaeaceae archaeon]